MTVFEIHTYTKSVFEKARNISSISPTFWIGFFFRHTVHSKYTWIAEYIPLSIDCMLISRWKCIRRTMFKLSTWSFHTANPLFCHSFGHNYSFSFNNLCFFKKKNSCNAFWTYNYFYNGMLLNMIFTSGAIRHFWIFTSFRAQIKNFQKKKNKISIFLLIFKAEYENFSSK